MLHRVVEEVEQDLRERSRVGVRLERGRDIGFEAHVTRFRERTEGLERLRRDARDVARSAGDERRAAGRARGQEHVLDELREPAGLPVEDRQRAAGLFVVPRAAEEQRLGEEADLSERRAQLVRHGRDERLPLEREDSFAPHDEERRDGQRERAGQEPEDDGPPGARQPPDHEHFGRARVQRDLGGEAAQRPGVGLAERPPHHDGAGSGGPRAVDLPGRRVVHREGETGHLTAVRERFGEDRTLIRGAREKRRERFREHLEARARCVAAGKDDERAPAVHGRDDRDVGRPLPARLRGRARRDRGEEADGIPLVERGPRKLPQDAVLDLERPRREGIRKLRGL